MKVSLWRLAILLMFLLPHLSHAQDLAGYGSLGTLGLIHTRHPMNSHHPLAQQLLGIWRVIPGLEGGGSWYDPIGNHHGTLTNMTCAGCGFRGSGRQGAHGEMSFDGASTYVNMQDLTIWDFPNTTFTVACWFRTTFTGGTQYLVARRVGTGGGGWFLRLNADGTLTARILDAGNIPTVERITTTTGLVDGNWHQVTTLFTTDTTTVANNDVSIWIDGQQNQGSAGTAGGAYAICVGGSGCPLTFGSLSDQQAGSFLLGSLDDVRLYSRGIAASEIADSIQLARRGDPGLLNYGSFASPALSAIATGSFSPFFQ